MRICFASHNQHKVKEIAAIAPKSVEIYGLDELNISEDIPETGTTMEENSRLKAQYVFSRFKVPVFADDSGLEVDALNGEPGVYSARYAGPHRNHQDNINLLLTNLEGISDRSARFKSVITFIDQTGLEHQFEGTVEGHIEEKESGTNGFGYDPIFTPQGFAITFAQMTDEEKNALSHRASAFGKLLAYLQKINE